MKSPVILLFTLLAMFCSSIQAAVFLGNSGVMFEKVCSASPFFVRSFTRNAILKEIERQGYDEGVTESAMYQVIQTVTPEKFLQKTLAILDRHKSSTN